MVLYPTVNKCTRDIGVAILNCSEASDLDELLWYHNGVLINTSTLKTEDIDHINQTLIVPCTNEYIGNYSCQSNGFNKTFIVEFFESTEETPTEETPTNFTSKSTEVPGAALLVNASIFTLCAALVLNYIIQ